MNWRLIRHNAVAFLKGVLVVLAVVAIVASFFGYMLSLHPIAAVGVSIVILIFTFGWLIAAVSGWFKTK